MYIYIIYQIYYMYIMGGDFKYLPQRSGIIKINKGSGSMLQGQVFFLNLEITLPFQKLSYAFEEKFFFSVSIILWKKVIISQI